MRNHLILFFVLFICFLANNYALAQILDDSTKQVYGTANTTFITERDLLYNTQAVHYLDTLLDGFHQFSPVNERQNLYQDLGSIGTALRPLYISPPLQIGTTLGIEAYSPYLFNPENVRYYDLKAPMVEAFYVQGFRGDQFIDFTFTRSRNKNFNFGLQYRRLLSEKQFASQETQDLVADQHKFVAHFNLYTKRYKLLYHFSHLNLMAFETGGVLLDADDTPDSVFLFQLEAANLQNARSWQTQNNHHLYQEYSFAKGFQFFHTFDWVNQRDDYSDSNPFEASNRAFYRVFNTNSELYSFRQDSTSEGFRYRKFENMIGIKGDVGDLYYQIYAKNRTFDFKSAYENRYFRNIRSDTVDVNGTAVITNTTTDSVLVLQNLQETEFFVGGRIRYQFAEDIMLQGNLEYLIGKVDYRLSGEIRVKNLEAGFVSAAYSPSILQRQFASNHVFWENDFENMFMQHLFVNLRLATENKRLRFQPFASYTLINNYLYYNQQARPAQTSQEIQLIKAGFDWDYQFKKLRTQNTFIYALSTNEKFLRVPNILINSRLFCENCFLSRYLTTQIGVEMHYKSSYFADAYMPVSKQFHLQDAFEVRAYLIADFFINLDFGNARLFLKYYHFNSQNNKGYVTTPLYPGMRGTFAFGIHWRFFN